MGKLKYFLSEIFTVTSAKQAVQLIGLIILTICTGSFELLKHFWWYSLALTRELGVIAERLTPLALGVLDIVSKIIGGFYMLIAMIFRDYRYGGPAKGVSPPTSQPLQQPGSRPAITYGRDRFVNVRQREFNAR